MATNYGFDHYTFPKSIWFLLITGLLSLFFSFLIFSKKELSYYYSKKLFIFLSFLSGSFLISTIFSESPIQSLWGKFSNLQGLFFWIYIGLFFLICVHFFQKKEATNRFFQLTKTIGITASTLAILQFLNFDIFNKNFDIAEQVYRVFGSFGQPNMLGQWLIFPLTIFSFSIFQKLKKQDFSSNFYIDWIGFLLTFGTLIATKNRATWLAFAIVGAGIFFRSLKISNQKKYLAATAITAVGFLIPYLNLINGRSIASRLILWQNSFASIDLKNILFGSGISTFQDKFLPNMPADVFLYEQFYSLPNSPHNEFLSVLIERGIFGAVLYLIPIIFLAKLWWRKKIKTDTQKISALALAVSFFSVQFSFFTLEHFIFISAFAAIFLHETIKFSDKKIQFTDLKKALITLFLSIIAIFSFWSANNIYQTNVKIPHAIDAYLQQDADAFEKFSVIEKSAKYQSYPKKIMFNLFVQEFNQQENLEKILSRQATINKNYEFWLNSFLLASQKNDQPEMINSANQAIKLAPNAPIIYTTLGDEYFRKNNWIEAKKHYSTLLNLAPDWYNSNTETCQKETQCRLFIKHASAFDASMKKFEWMVTSGF